jgi:hypothetical protein
MNQKTQDSLYWFKKRWQDVQKKDFQKIGK